jgi:microcystin degradation protein MlrC
MRVLLARMKHETNTFSPVPTDLARFARGQPSPLYGARGEPSPLYGG